MFILRSFLKYRTIIYYATALGLVSHPGTIVHALSTDRLQPIEIKADNARLDNTKGIANYNGNVVITQGSIRVTGDSMTAYFNGEELQTIIIEGQPAHYKQLPDNSRIYDQAKALKMEYHHKKNLVILTGQASFRRADTKLNGERIEYNSLNNKISLASGNSTDDSGYEQVKIVINPNQQENE